jgi:hypothetical protein
MPAELRVDEGLNEEYERIKRRFLAQGHILAIKECPAELFKLPPKEMLAASGITGCTVLEYTSDTIDSTRPANDRIGGRTVGVLDPEGQRRSVIFMRNDYPPEYSPALALVCKVCMLYHELGHADDFREGVNFQHEKGHYSAKRSEAYADDFAKRHLRRIRCIKVVDGQERRGTLWDWYREVRYVGEFSN